jgi:hypothetical protein
MPTITNTYSQVNEGEIRPIPLREFLRLKPGDEVLIGFPHRLVQVTFTRRSPKHPRSRFQFEGGKSTELHRDRLYVYVSTIPERDEIHEMVGYDS